MKRVLFLSLCVALGSTLGANAENITAYTGDASLHTTPLATLKVTRTVAGSWDSLDINLLSWLLPSWQTGGANGNGAEVNALGGTFTAVGTGAYISLPTGNASQWPGRMTWNYSAGTPTSAAPASFVNMENVTGTFSRTGTSPNFTSVYGDWFTNSNGLANLSVVDVTPPSDLDLDDGKDETLLARFYVTHGANVSFVADPGNGIDGFGTTSDTVYMAFTTVPVPEPSTLVLGGIAALAFFAFRCWGRRKAQAVA